MESQFISGRMIGAASRAAEAVTPALRAAAARTGASFEALFQTARLESGFNPDARARTSSATGLFQFIESTWLSTLARHGARHGIAPASRGEALALRRDPAVASLMAAEHMEENRARLETALGRPASTVDLYLAHFLGAGGATRFLARLADAPEQAAATLFPAAARANRGIFHTASGAARSLADVHQLFARKLGGGAGEATPAGGAVQAALPARITAAGAQPGTITAASGGDEAEAARMAAARAAQAAYLLLAELGG